MINCMRCTKCIQSVAFPRIKFDNEGVCNFCRNEFNNVIEDNIIQKNQKTVEHLFETTEHCSEYDAVMCFSGGKDSTYVLQFAVKKFKLKVLAFTLDNGFLSNTALKNIYRVVEHLGVDLMMFRPSKTHFTSIIRASMLKPVYNPKTLTRISAGCNSCISMVNTTALKIAIEKKIPFILAGFNLGQIPINAITYKNNYRFLQESRMASLKVLRREAGAFIDNYYLINEEILNTVKKFPTTINLLCLEKITENEIVEKNRQIGWKTPTDVDGCSSNCRLNTFNNYIHQKIFGYNPYELELSHLIRKRCMTREEAIKKINDQPTDQHKEIQLTLGITDDNIAELMKNV